MIVTNTEGIAGHNVVQILGLVQGNTVRAKHAGRDIAAGLKNLVGGELKGYTELLTDCLLYTSPSPRDQRGSRMPSSA